MPAHNLKVGPLAVDPRRFVPLFMDDLPAVALSGSQSVLGEAALAKDSLSGGLHAVGDVPFCFGRGGLDISTSTKGLKEPLRWRSRTLWINMPAFRGGHWLKCRPMNTACCT